jgi:hypothetical protein
MALRAFYLNPALGGFGGESTEIALHAWSSSIATTAADRSELLNSHGGDALAQIVKELVENAMDACRAASHSPTQHQQQQPKRRVRVLIDPYVPETESMTTTSTHDDATHDGSSSPPTTSPATSSNSQELLRITVMDNGCGMGNVQESVASFHSSKSKIDTAHDTTTTGKNKFKQQKTKSQAQQQTAGRYGVGLTCKYPSATCALSYSTFTSHSMQITLHHPTIFCPYLQYLFYMLNAWFPIRVPAFSLQHRIIRIGKPSFVLPMLSMMSCDATPNLPRQSHSLPKVERLSAF